LLLVLGKINLALSFDEKAKEPLPFAPAVDIRVVRSMLVTSLKTPSVYESRADCALVIGNDALFGKSRMSYIRYTAPFCDRIYGRSRMYLRYGLVSAATPLNLVYVYSGTEMQEIGLNRF